MGREGLHGEGWLNKPELGRQRRELLSWDTWVSQAQVTLRLNPLLASTVQKKKKKSMNLATCMVFNPGQENVTKNYENW